MVHSVLIRQPKPDFSLSVSAACAQVNERQRGQHQFGGQICLQDETYEEQDNDVKVTFNNDETTFTVTSLQIKNLHPAFQTLGGNKVENLTVS